MGRKLDYGVVGGKGLSYSRRQTLNSCPRKFQLENIYNLGLRDDSNVDFAFGHAVGAGVQHLLWQPHDLHGAVIRCAAAWDIDILIDNIKANKSLAHAVRAVKIFHQMVSSVGGFLRDYEIAIFNGKPAIELTFCIHLHDGFLYEGHIDVILFNPKTNHYLVVELKTTKFNNIHESMYKNSSQALGYSIVLDSIAADHGAQNSYYVMYLVYKTGAMLFEQFLFPKSRYQRAKFLNDLLLDCERLDLYALANHYPQQGEACFNFFRPCQFLDTCNLSDESLLNLTKELAGSDDTPFSKMTSFDFEYTIEDIKQQQLQIIKDEVIASDSTT